jgi:hypothetical protein
MFLCLKLLDRKINSIHQLLLWKKLGGLVGNGQLKMEWYAACQTDVKFENKHNIRGNKQLHYKQEHF